MGLLRIVDEEKGKAMLADVALRPLKSLVRQTRFLLKHVVQLLSRSFRWLSITLAACTGIHILVLGLLERRSVHRV